MSLIRSHVLEFVESRLHRVDIVGLSGSLGGGSDLALSGCDLPTSFHGLLVAHLSEELHNLTVVD